MSDRELLEFVAKAAFMDINFEEPVNDYYPNGYLECGDVDKWWNPLINDGDALRLAVKLQLTVCNEHIQSGAAYCTRGEQETFKDAPGATNGEGEVLAEDYAATRRAIVLAAAEIGRAIP